MIFGAGVRWVKMKAINVIIALIIGIIVLIIILGVIFPKFHKVDTSSKEWLNKTASGEILGKGSSIINNPVATGIAADIYVSEELNLELRDIKSGLKL